MKLLVTFVFPILVLILVSCAAPATSAPEDPTQTVSPVPTSGPTETPVPAPASLDIGDIPGFEEWAIFNEPAVDVHEQDGALLLTLNRRALWYMDQRGVLAYKAVEGDFMITADVYSTKSSDPSQAPGGDGTVQLGGLMARNGSGGRENYVFIVVGSNSRGLIVETKNTVDDFSEYDGPLWNSPNASLRLCRSGQTFDLYKREIGSDSAWTLAGSFERPDLPESLQVGLNIYTDGAPDLQVRYENVVIESLTSPEQCGAG